MKKAVLWINIGSPDSLKHEDVKNYLTEFLMDPRVINYPYWLRYLLFQRFIIPRRVSSATEAYSQVWLKESPNLKSGSPLLHYTKALIDDLNAKDSEYDWFWAMRYSSPKVNTKLQELIDAGYEEIVIFPAYPQFADSSTTSSLDVVKEFFKKAKLEKRWQGKIKYIEDFYVNKSFISNIVEECQKTHSNSLAHAEHVLFSFHGLPESHLRMIHKDCKSANCETRIGADNKKCYKAQCYQTAKAVAEALGISHKYSVSFQSRLGPSKWIEPYTDVVVEEELAGKKGIKSLVVFSLAFVTDCLETLEELDIRLKESFLGAGGKEFHRVPCLNERFTSAYDILRTEDLKILEL